MLTQCHEGQRPQKDSSPSHIANVFSSPFKAPATATILLWDVKLRRLSLPFSKYQASGLKVTQGEVKYP